MVQVIAKVPCVTRVGETPVSLAKGRTYDLPAPVADKLVKASLCDRVGGQVQTQESHESAEANPAPDDKAPAKPRSRKAPTKKVDAAPENK